MEATTGRSGSIDPDYFALKVRWAFREPYAELDERPEDSLAELAGPSTEELLVGGAALAQHPAVVELDERVLDAEIAVIAAEDAGQIDEVAQRRLDKTRQERRELLVRLQKARTAVHTRRADMRSAQVLPLRPFRVVRGGEAA